jgi:hypothetical protein
MWRARSVLAMAAVATLAAGCGASVDPAVKSDIDKRVSLLTSPSQTFPAPAAPTPLPIAVGQWVQYKGADEKGQPSFLTLKVVDELQGTYWVEYVSESYYGKTVTKMNLYLGDRTKLDTIDVRAVKVKDAKGVVTEFPPETLAGLKDTWQNLLGMLVLSWDGLPQEDVTVPAGTFSQCWKARTDGSWGPWKSASTSWSHAAVPLSGLVKSQGLDRPTTLELVAFGTTGGTSSEIP